MLEKHDLLRHLVPREMLQGPKDLLVHFRTGSVQRQQLAPVGPDEILDPGPPFQLLEVRHHQHDRKAAPVADHYRLCDVLAALHGILDRLRGDVLSAGSYDDVLLAVGDPQKPILELADVAGVEPLLLIDHLGGGFGLVVVSLHYVRTTRENLAIRCDAHLDPRQRPADGADPEVL